MNEKNIKVSVIVPVYNTSKYLKKCIESILKQSLKEIEIICINDGSTDNSLEILEKYLKKDSRVRIINQKNSGLSKVRNEGLKLAKGKYIMSIDSDDWIKENYFEKMYSIAEMNNLDLVFSAINIERNDEIVEKIYDTKLDKIIDGKQYLENLLQELSFGAVWNKLIKKEICLKNNIYFNEKIFLGEDYNFLCRLAPYLNRVGGVEEAYYVYRKGENNGSSKVKEKNIKDILLGYNQLREVYKGNLKIIELIDRKECIEISNIIFNQEYQKFMAYKEIEKEFLQLLSRIKLYSYSNLYRKKILIILILNILILFPNKVILKFVLNLQRAKRILRSKKNK